MPKSKTQHENWKLKTRRKNSSKVKKNQMREILSDGLCVSHWVCDRYLHPVFFVFRSTSLRITSTTSRMWGATPWGSPPLGWRESSSMGSLTGCTKVRSGKKCPEKRRRRKLGENKSVISVGKRFKLHHAPVWKGFWWISLLLSGARRQKKTKQERNNLWSSSIQLFKDVSEIHLPHLEKKNAA